MRSIRELKTVAATIPQADAVAARIYSEHGDLLASMVSENLGERDDLDELIGTGNAEIMADNHRKHALFVASMLHHFRPELFVETLLWVFRTYRARGFTTAYWRVQLDAWCEAVADALPVEAAAAVDPLYSWILDNLDELVALSEHGMTLWEGELTQHGHGD